MTSTNRLWRRRGSSLWPSANSSQQAIEWLEATLADVPVPIDGH